MPLTEHDAALQLKQHLEQLLRAPDKELLARQIDQFCREKLMSDASYPGYTEDFKELIDECFLLPEWKGDGVRFEGQLVFGENDVKDIIQELGKVLGKR